MRGVKQFAGILSLATLALWFGLSLGTAFASGQSSHAPAADSHAAAVDAGHAVEGSHGDAAAAEHGGGSLSAAKLKDLGWRIVNFIALMIILVKFGAKPIGAGLASRRTQIREEIEGLEQKRADAEQSYDAFQVKLANVESEIDTIVDRAVAQAEIEKKKIIEKAEMAAEDIKRSAEMVIQNEITEARRSLKDEVADQAALMAEELIVKNLTDDDQVKIIDDYLVKVGAVQ
ncbi:MAG: F0F1 ATP synthase subunit B [Deltaproteobacteria bacterium]|nr:F0F1 ATP synthase subunit B [Deltaproteobacteria bacterium]MBW2658766.1 F0F1 ATP synthase subunit B [Deltaproteobacteria bacterium]